MGPGMIMPAAGTVGKIRVSKNCRVGHVLRPALSLSGECAVYLKSREAATLSAAPVAEIVEMLGTKPAEARTSTPVALTT